MARKGLDHKQDHDWFLFSSGLMQVLCSDYIALRILHRLEPLTAALAIAPKMLDVVEKSMKLFIAIQTKTSTALTDARCKYGHDIERLRKDCAAYESVFDDGDVREFTKDLNDRDGKLYQHLRYGSQETTAGFEANLDAAMPIVDKVFCNALVLLPEAERRLLLLPSLLKNLVTGKFDQSQHRNEILGLVRAGNPHFAKLELLFRRLDGEQMKLIDDMRAGAATPPD
jgi:hypothetical protein